MNNHTKKLHNENSIPFVSVIIITRNRPKILADCLDHLAKQTYSNFEIIVVDSSDNHETRGLLVSWPKIHYLNIWDGRNNMPAARNLGISKAYGEIVAFIDDDSMVHLNWLNDIVSGYSYEKVGGVGGRIFDERLKIDADEVRIGKVLPDGRVIANFSRVMSNPTFTDWFCGCNMSFQRSILNDLGGFDQKYGGNNSYEDVDMSIRVRKAGFSLLLVPGAVVEHIYAPRSIGVVSRDYENPQVRYHHVHNRAYFVTKNIGINKVYISYVLKELYLSIVYALKRPRLTNFKLLGATFLGFISGSCDYCFNVKRK